MLKLKDMKKDSQTSKRKHLFTSKGKEYYLICWTNKPKFSKLVMIGGYFVSPKDDYEVKPDECRYLMLKIIEQAVRDFIVLEHSTAPIDQYFYETAVDFLFDDEYLIQWGDTEIGLEHMLEFLGLEVDWAREKALLAKEKKLESFAIKEALKGKQ